LQLDPVPPVSLDLPKRPEWGDLASTVAMSVASSERRPPHDVAQIILDNMRQPDTIFERVEIAKPGFLNMTLRRELWLEVLSEIETQGTRYGHCDLGNGRTVLVEYVSANPTGPLHVGHGRGAAVGHALSNLLRAAGYDVATEYYVNDAGRQMRMLGASVYARYLERNGIAAPFPEEGYRGAYIDRVAEAVQERVGASLLQLPPEEAEARCRDLAGRGLLDQIRQDLHVFGIDFDSWFSEASLVSAGSIQRVLDELQTRGFVFDQDGALWFRSSAFGDDKDRVIQKQDGEWTYLASDIAYHRDKLERGYDQLIDVWGADHHGYIPRMQAAVQAYGHPKERLRVVLVQMVNLLRGGTKVEMSKRAGEFITLREVMDEVGADAAKFFFLMRRADSHLDFDLDLAKQQSAENPVYYVQYAHARLSSLFRVAADRGIPVPGPHDAELELLKDPDEFSLIRKLSAYPSIVAGSAASLEPHRLTFYLQELAALLHTYYYKHRIMPPAADGDTEPDALVPNGSEVVPLRETVTAGLTGARLALMREVRQVIANGLGLLGISAPDRM
jgi:arginyl-tRNA synthetase